VLSYEVMGVLALGIVWVNALLVAGAALKELGPVRAVARAAKAGMVRGEVTQGAGAGGTLAAHRIEQVGRATDAGEILFGDRSHASEVFGGAIRVAGGDREIEIAPAPAAVASPVDLGDGAVEAWPGASVTAAAAACLSPERFAEALEAGKKARGFARTVEATIGVGEEVYVVGEVRGDGDRVELVGPPRLVSTIDPRAWAARKARAVVLFVVAELAFAAASTAVALWPPAFGLVSKLGGALCLAFFLGVQPLGTALRDAVRSPARHPLRGRWNRPPSGAPERAAAPS
jgi:hypothetical protein